MQAEKKMKKIEKNEKNLPKVFFSPVKKKVCATAIHSFDIRNTDDDRQWPSPCDPLTFTCKYAK